MKYLLIILLFPFLSFSQDKNAVKHHYAAAVTAVAVGAATYQFFKIPILNGFCGFTAGVSITNFKENTWDGKWGKGVKSEVDKHDGYWGAFCGGFYVNAGAMIDKNKKEFDKEYFNNLNDTCTRR